MQTYTNHITHYVTLLTYTYQCECTSIRTILTYNCVYVQKHKCIQMYRYIPVCTHIQYNRYMCSYTQTSVYIYISCIRMCITLYIQMQVYVRKYNTYIYIYVYMRMKICIYKKICKYTKTVIYLSIYIYTYIYMYVFSSTTCCESILHTCT